jgi:hypothetical protein
MCGYADRTDKHSSKLCNPAGTALVFPSIDGPVAGREQLSLVAPGFAERPELSRRLMGRVEIIQLQRTETDRQERPNMTTRAHATRRPASLAIRTGLRAGGMKQNHSQNIRVRANVRAGGISINHNQSR